jgi:hypothetical protein
MTHTQREILYSGIHNLNLNGVYLLFVTGKNTDNTRANILHVFEGRISTSLLHFSCKEQGLSFKRLNLSNPSKRCCERYYICITTVRFVRDIMR